MGLFSNNDKPKPDKEGTQYVKKKVSDTKKIDKLSKKEKPEKKSKWV